MRLTPVLLELIRNTWPRAGREMRITPALLELIRKTWPQIRVITRKDLTEGITGMSITSVLFDELHKDADMVAKQKSKQKPPSRPAFPPQKRMPVTVRDPLSRRVVKRK